MNKPLSALVILLFLSACAMPPSRQETYDLIKSEINKAATSKPKQAAPDAVAAALLPDMKADLPPVRKPLEERFSVNISNAPAAQFFMGIVSGTPYNMLVSADVTGNISANLKDVTLFEALDAIREMYGYEFKMEGSRIFVRASGMQIRVFQINYLATIRKGSSDIRVTSGSVGDTAAGQGSGNGNSSNTQNPGANPNDQQNSNGGSSRAFTSSKINTTSTNDFWAELRTSIEILANKGQDGRQVVINPQSGVVVVRAMSDELRNIAAYLKATQLSVDRQVILEAKILEVELNEQFQTGINWASFASIKGISDNAASMGFVSPGSNLSTTKVTATDTGITATTGLSLGAAARAANAGSLFGLAFQTANFSALLSFLESQGTVHVLSSPRIATLNNQMAVLKVGKDEFFVTSLKTNPGVANSSGTSAPTVSLDVQPFFSGVALDVTPQIDGFGNVTLHVHPSVSNVTTVEKIVNAGTAGSVSLPLASSSVSETDSVVRGQNGQIIAIGGLMRQASVNDRSQVPGAGDVPLLGSLFKNTNRVSQKRELVILIRPTVVDGEGAWEQDLLDSQKRIDGLAPKKYIDAK